MSAFILPKSHLDYLLTAALKWSDGAFSFGAEVDLTKGTADELGYATEENRRWWSTASRCSVSCRNGERTLWGVIPQCARWLV